MIATVEGSILLEAVSQNPAAAVLAVRGKGMDGAFEAIERMFFSHDHNLERLVVVVAAGSQTGMRCLPKTDNGRAPTVFPSLHSGIVGDGTSAKASLYAAIVDFFTRRLCQMNGLQKADLPQSARFISMSESDAVDGTSTGA